MDDMYRELIIEHYKNPSYRGTLDPCDHSYEDENPSCGDELRIMLNVDENNIITDARFEGHGCAISQASADLLLEEVIGKNVDEVKNMTKEDVLDLLGLETLGPARIKCAMLSLKCLKAGLYGVEGHAWEDIIS